MAGVSRSNITYFVNGGAPRDELFRRIFTLWNNDVTASHLFRAHLRDEAGRAGLDPTKLDAGSASTSELLCIEDDLHALRRLLIADPEVRPFIRKMAADFRAAHRTVPYPKRVEFPAQEVAEAPAAYGEKKSPAKPAKKSKRSK